MNAADDFVFPEPDLAAAFEAVTGRPFGARFGRPVTSLEQARLEAFEENRGEDRRDNPTHPRFFDADDAADYHYRNEVS